MRNFFTILFLMVSYLFFLPTSTMADQAIPKEKALQALKGEDYQTAINICQSQLKVEPANYEFSFILSRAYAYSGQWEQALSLLDRMLVTYPDNLDLLLFRSRVQAWKGNY
jgi:tetratricopeptide (TPR) repeat protein